MVLLSHCCTNATITNLEKKYQRTQEQTNKKKICGFCLYKKRRMTKYSCHSCKKAICGEHTVPTCYDMTARTEKNTFLCHRYKL